METLTSNGFWVKRHTVLKNENSSLEWNQVEYGAVRLSRCKFQVNINVIFNLFFPTKKKRRKKEEEKKNLNQPS